MMRPKHGLAVAVIACVLATLALAASEPRLHFDKTTHDFGEIRSDEPQEFLWPYSNAGDGPLEIVGTKPQCGCTATLLDGEQIAPGEGGTMRVTFDPAGLDGTIRKSLAVMSNDPVNPRMLLSLRATVIPVQIELAEGEHPPIAGQSMLAGDCASCHAAPAAGTRGEALYAAVCAMCHGDTGTGTALAPGVLAADYLASRSDEELAIAIAYGTANPKMPGFSDLMGGPLDEAQVDSLVALLRQWGPAPRAE